MATNRKRTIADFSKDEDFAETKHHAGNDDWEATRMAAPTVGVAARLFKTGTERSVTVQVGATSASLEMQTLDGKVAQFAWDKVKYDAPMAGAPGIFELPNGLTIEVADHTAFKQIAQKGSKGPSRLLILGIVILALAAAVGAAAMLLR
jgi:hypothetical protein